MSVICQGYHNTGIHDEQELKEKDILIINSMLDRMDCNEITQRIVQQIGSMSERATIWKAIMDDYIIAIKIPNLITNNDKEFELSYELSRIYKNNFLRMFNIKKCNIEINNQKFQSNLLFMELAVGDLRQCIKNIIKISDLKRYILDVFDALIVLNNENINHNDLHIGNVFIVNASCGTRAVIGDFGESGPAAFNTVNVNDVQHFFSSLRGDISNYSYLDGINYNINLYLRNIVGPYYNQLELSGRKSDIRYLKSEWIKLIDR